MIRDYTDLPEGDVPKPKAEPPRVVPCPDCGAAIPETIELGKHAPRMLQGRLVNCVGRVLE